MSDMSGESLLNLFLTAVICVVGSVAVVAFHSAWLAMFWGVAMTAWGIRTIAQLKQDTDNKKGS